MSAARTPQYLALALTALLMASALGQEAAPEVANEKFNFVGEVTTDNVYVRSGPSDNYYPTMKLDKGTQVTVVGQKFEWLKIAPPEGSFSYVAKVYVQRRGDGSVGRVTKADLMVKAGSSLNAMKTSVQTKLDEGADVQILGEQDEYFKIKSPADAYLYINKQFVVPVKVVAQADNAGNSKPAAPAAEAPTADAPTAAAPVPQAESATPATQPVELVAATTQPVTNASELEFDKAEAQFLAASELPLDQQPVDALVKNYQALSQDAQLPGSMKRIAEHRLRTMQIRAEAAAELQKARKADAEAKERALAQKAERDELAQRIRQQDIAVYAAIGTLRTSSLQFGRDRLYRLTDPGTGRTLVYLKSNDGKLAEMLGQFIGVRGQIETDSQKDIRLIAPTAAEPVDQANLSKVAAQVMPPSLMPKTAPSANVNE